MSSPRCSSGSEDDPPAARTTGVVVEGTADLDAQRRAGPRMQHGRSRVGVEQAVDDLGVAMGRRVEHILVGRSRSRAGIARPCRSACCAHRLAPRLPTCNCMRAPRSLDAHVDPTNNSASPSGGRWGWTATDGPLGPRESGAASGPPRLQPVRDGRPESRRRPASSRTMPESGSATATGGASTCRTKATCPAVLRPGASMTPNPTIG